MVKSTLLIVDDDEVMILLLKKLFEKKYTVYTASDGVEAMHCLSQGVAPDLIICDILMENINGYEFIKHLMTSIIYKNIPVIVLSGVPRAELSHQLPPLLKTISKPFDPLQLVNVVETTILKAYDINFMQ